MEKYLAKTKNFFYFCFSDFKKAYDSICREFLTKLLRWGISRNFLSLPHSMYAVTKLSVKLSGNISNLHFQCRTKIRMHYESFLFNLFINDIKSIFDKTYCQPEWIGIIAINCVLYADNLVIMFETSSSLQNTLNRLQL